jgi:histidine triad (HIT) family protein
LEEKEYMDLMAFSRKLAMAIERVIPCNRVGLSVIGLEVPHCHVHLIPLENMGSINFGNSIEMSPQEFESIAEKIRESFENS